MILISSLVWGLISYAIGSAFAKMSQVDFFGWVVGFIVFGIGLVIILIIAFISTVFSYPQDRADARQTMADINADFRASEREWNEDRRLERYISASKPGNTYDNRQVNIHYGGRGRKSEE